MDTFEYKITKHNIERFTQLVYFCSAQGECGVAQVPPDEPSALEALLNEQGLLGWELVQLLFGKDGLIACWKRKRTVFVEPETEPIPETVVV
jgi:hypothetical protein